MRNVRMVMAVAAVCLAIAGMARAEGKIQLELYSPPGFNAGEAQQWYQVFKGLEVDGLQIKGGDAKPEIITRGSDANPTYVIRGKFTKTGTLHLPGGSYTRRDRGRLATWFAELRKWGPQGAPQGKPLYGLNAQQFGAIKRDLGRKVLFTTKGKNRKETFDRIVRGLSNQVVVEADAQRAFDSTEEVFQELTGLSSGTSMACLLRPVGLTFEPRRRPSGDLEYVVMKGEKSEEPWPVGWEPEQKRVKVMPILLEFLNVEIEPTPLVDVVKVLKEHLKVPILLDVNNVVKHDIDLNKQVSFPSKRTYYDKLLRTLLAQAKLVREVRVDEAGQPFIWVTTFKK